MPQGSKKASVIADLFIRGLKEIVLTGGQQYDNTLFLML